MNILFVNLPPASTKKSGNSLYWLQSSMNLGLLSVASAATQQGHHVAVYDWLGDHQYPLLERLPALIGEFKPALVGLSMPSGYGEDYCGPVSRMVRTHAPEARVIVGGQYHAGMRPNEVLDRFSEVDAVVVGDGDLLMWEELLNCSLSSPPRGIVTREARSTQAAEKGRASPPRYRFELNQLDIRSYAPSIEIARGCPFTCSFCSLSGAPSNLDRASKTSIKDQLSFWLKIWKDLERVPIYFECPVFFCNGKTLGPLQECLTPFADRIEWRAQCRVDSVDPSVLPALRQVGLRILDLGLESASARMLALMEKTHNPERYLYQAQKLIDAAAECEVGIKLNILLFPGETNETAAETEAFIYRNRGKIAGIAAGAAIEFPGSALSKQLAGFSKLYGTRRNPDPRLSASGVIPLDLSTDFPLGRAREWCLRVTRSVTTAESYFALKRIGYFRPDFKLEDMLKAAREADSDRLPFEDHAAPAFMSKTKWDMAEWDQLR